MNNNGFDTVVHLTAESGTTPMSIADAVIRECADKEWLEDVIFFLQVYVDRTYKREGVTADE